MRDYTDVGSSSPDTGSLNFNKSDCNFQNIKKLPFYDPLPCNGNINLLKDIAFIQALEKELSRMPESPHKCDSELFMNIRIPYIYYWNKQYSLAIDAWELLFEKIQQIDIKRYESMHKGLPFYFCGMAAFEGKDFEKAVFYFDAALHEDANNYDKISDNQQKFHEAPAALFLTLQDMPEDNSFVPTAHELTRRTRILMLDALIRFYDKSRLEFKLEELQELFLRKSLDKKNAEWRSAATALLSYILESDTRKIEFSLRSVHGGTMESFFLHLFKGCLLFETLLKMSPKWKGDKRATIENVIKDKNIVSLLELDNKYKSSGITFEKAVEKNKLWLQDNITCNNRVCWTTYAIRNTTGHNLSWSASDMTDEDFENLSDDILFANFLVLSKLFR
jgi:tetratricopeptide (TPR) repeat protein